MYIFVANACSKIGRQRLNACRCLNECFKHWHAFKHQRPIFECRCLKHSILCPGSAADGGRGKSFSGCRGADEYVQLYTPRTLLQENHSRGEKFLKKKRKKTFKNNGIKCKRHCKEYSTGHS